MENAGWRATGIAACATLLLATPLAGLSQAANVACGQTITQDTTLTADVGPCPGNGIVVGADGIVVNLAGHRVSGTSGPGDGTAAGIRLPARTGVRIVGPGRISGFDAGVLINGGSGNTVRNLAVRDNIGPADTSAELGDGIAVLNSADNLILNNDVIHNGVYDGIGVLGDGSDNNVLQGNRVEHTDPVGNTTTPEFNPTGFGIGIIINNFLDLSTRGQSIFANKVLDNSVRKNFGAGISNVSNVDGQVIGNIVEDNGLTYYGVDDFFYPGNGIGVQRSRGIADPATRVLIHSNRVVHNGQIGIFVTEGAAENRVSNNTVLRNGFVGIAAGPGENRIIRNRTGSNLILDLLDTSYITEARECDDNVWRGNTWGPLSPQAADLGFTKSFFPDCVAGTDASSATARRSAEQHARLGQVGQDVTAVRGRPPRDA